jgi:hypothetical protein
LIAGAALGVPDGAPDGGPWASLLSSFLLHQRNSYRGEAIPGRISLLDVVRGFTARSDRMLENKRKEYCSIDHANKQKELARFTPYEFWTNQVKRRPFRQPEKNQGVKAKGP